MTSFAVRFLMVYVGFLETWALRNQKSQSFLQIKVAEEVAKQRERQKKTVAANNIRGPTEATVNFGSSVPIVNRGSDKKEPVAPPNQKASIPSVLVQKTKPANINDGLEEIRTTGNHAQPNQKESVPSMFVQHTKKTKGAIHDKLEPEQHEEREKPDTDPQQKTPTSSTLIQKTQGTHEEQDKQHEQQYKQKKRRQEMLLEIEDKKKLAETPEKKHQTLLEMQQKKKEKKERNKKEELIHNKIAMSGKGDPKAEATEGKGDKKGNSKGARETGSDTSEEDDKNKENKDDKNKTDEKSGDKIKGIGKDEMIKANASSSCC